MFKKTVLFLSLLAVFLGFTNAHAVVINFGDYNLGPSDTLKIEGVTVSSRFGQPAAVLGVGLGVDGIGSPGYLDRVSHYGAGQIGTPYNPTYSTQMEGLDLKVDGVLNSFTLKPYFNNNVNLPIGFTYLDGAPDYPGAILREQKYVDLDPTVSSYTFTLQGSIPVDSTFIQLSSYWDELGTFFQYLFAHGYPDVTFQYGFTIASIDYTPNQVPEISTLLLLCCGLMGCEGFRRRFKRN